MFGAYGCSGTCAECAREEEDCMDGLWCVDVGGFGEGVWGWDVLLRELKFGDN